jgi:hypothetical protein
MRAAIKAMQMEDIPSYLHALDSIAKLYGLFDATAINISMAQLQMPKVIFANSDLETLKREMEQQTAPLNIDG